MLLPELAKQKKILRNRLSVILERFQQRLLKSHAENVSPCDMLPWYDHIRQLISPVAVDRDSAITFITVYILYV